MTRNKYLTGWSKSICCGVLLAALTGCVGYVEGPGYVGPDYIGPDFVPVPEVTVFGGYDHGHYDRDAGRRGAESRGWAGHR